MTLKCCGHLYLKQRRNPWAPFKRFVYNAVLASKARFGSGLFMLHQRNGQANTQKRPKLRV